MIPYVLFFIILYLNKAQNGEYIKLSNLTTKKQNLQRLESRTPTSSEEAVELTNFEDIHSMIVAEKSQKSHMVPCLLDKILICRVSLQFL